MDPEPFSAKLYRWCSHLSPLPPPPPQEEEAQPPHLRELGDFFQPYGIHYFTVTKIVELGFTLTTLPNMSDQELDEMMLRISQIFCRELLVGEKYGVRAAIRAERGRLLQNTTASSTLDTPSHEVQQEKGMRGSRGVDVIKQKSKKKRKRVQQLAKATTMEIDGDDIEDDQEVARSKMYSIGYLFSMYEECREFLFQVQNIARARGEECPTKVNSQVFSYAHDAGATHINKLKFRHYMHCYALHCLDKKQSNALRKLFNENGQTIGAWRQACYEPLVKLAGQNGWDIKGIFNEHPILSSWYVPTKLRELCHAQQASAPLLRSYVTSLILSLLFLVFVFLFFWFLE